MRNSGRLLLVLSVLLLVVLVAAWMVNRQDPRTPGDKVADVIEAIPEAVDSAAADFSASSPVAKAADAIERAGDVAESAISRAGEKTADAMSETSADLKAAKDKQEEQDRADARRDNDRKAQKP